MIRLHAGHWYSLVNLMQDYIHSSFSNNHTYLRGFWNFLSSVLIVPIISQISMDEFSKLLQALPFWPSSSLLNWIILIIGYMPIISESNQSILYSIVRLDMLIWTNCSWSNILQAPLALGHPPHYINIIDIREADMPGADILLTWSSSSLYQHCRY